ncbi:MAG: hypothetical protein IPL50_09055 [Chitinophagaceae bacterium]|nr:hypothetical protein [Chitinophagaceae bacterium]
MFVKYLHWLGMAACITLIVSCFLPWVYFADINQTFTGFYSYQNQYGRPGNFLTIFGALVLLFMLLPKIWAKRTNLFVCAITLAYAIKTYILFSSCYNNYCPQKLPALYLMVGCTVVMLISSGFPNLKLAVKKEV